mgnify:CR=1 FL=1
MLVLRLFVITSCVASLIVNLFNLYSSGYHLCRLLANDENGARRSNAIRQVITDVPLVASSITLFILYFNSLLAEAPLSQATTPLYTLGLTFVAGLPWLYFACGVYALVHRGVYQSRAASISRLTAPHKAVVLSKIKGLAVYPDKRGSQPLDVSYDFQSITESSKRIEFHTLRGLSITLDLLQKECLKRKVDILHIAAHGDGHKGILLSDGFARPESLTTSILASGAKIVILATCNSEPVAEAVISVMSRAVVYTRESIDDRHAIAFSGPFIRGIGEGLSVLESFNLGCAMIPSNVAANSLRFIGDGSFRLRPESVVQ